MDIDAGVATLALARPPVNAFDQDHLDRFADALRDLRVHDDVGVVLIRSDAPHFSSGADVKALLSPQGVDGGDGVDRKTAFAASMQALWGELAELPLTTVAAIRGAAIGGGLELALACDMRIAARSARLGLPEVKLGLLPAAGGTQRLTWLAGSGAAARLMLTGELVDAETALQLGVVEWVVDDDLLDRRALEIATAVAQQSRPAMAEIKRCIAEAFGQSGFETEIEATRRLHRTAEAQLRLREFVGGAA